LGFNEYLVALSLRFGLPPHIGDYPPVSCKRNPIGYRLGVDHRFSRVW
jgi:hypothetical protein